MTTPWDYIQQWDLERMGAGISSPELRRTWSGALGRAGAVPYIWRELAGPVRQVIYGLLELRPGDRVLLIGEALQPSGFVEDMRSAIGPDGRLDAIDLAGEARRVAAERREDGTGTPGCWPWRYTQHLAEAAYDMVGVLQATRYCDDWAVTGPELLRVMRPGRRIVVAEAVPAGPRFTERVNADVHLQQWYRKLAAATVGPSGSPYPYYSGAQLAEIMGAMVDDPQFLEHRGIELFWARKRPGAER